jgi:ABC-type sugar transport system ATPase subunit
MAEVALEQVDKTYPGGVAALRQVSLRAEDGELLALVGPSGSGKTTLLRLIAGLEAPTAGTVSIGGRAVNGLPPHRRDVAMVFQRPALYPHLSVRANLDFGLKMRRRGFAGPPVEEVARWLGLSDVLDRLPGTLSGGQQQRVALGRALVRRPAVFLLDKPLADLDARLRLEMRRELHLLRRRLHATIIYVTHDQDEAMALGDRVVVLDQGLVRQVGRPRELYQRPADRFVAGFLGWPPMNLLDGRLVEEAGQLAFRSPDGGLVIPGCRRPDWLSFAGRPVTLGIRPEDVDLADGPAAPEEGRLVMAVGLVEWLGPTCLATCQAGGWTVTARLAATVGHPPTEGCSAVVAFAWAPAHLFDAATGCALAHGRSEAEASSYEEAAPHP